tara:strand:+ start:3601 stop:3882 length:282 start_codon:yes stop_codon:yes gene_type:complete
MIDKRFFEEISQQISKLLPQAEAAGDDIKRSVSSALQKGFARMDLLTREEFEAQLAALSRAEQRIEALESELVQLESRIQELEAGKASTPKTR